MAENVQRIDYSGAPVTWRKIVTATKSGDTTQLQATIRFKVQDGYKEDGTPRMVTRRKSKLFDKDADLDTDRKKNNAVKSWKRELMQQQEDAIARAEALAEDEAARKAAEEEEARRKAEAMRIAEEEEAKRKAEEAHRSTPSYKLVGDYVDWYVDLISRSLARSTLDTYRQSAKRIGDGFKHTRMENLTKHQVQLWVNRMVDGGLSPQTVTKHFRLLSQACKYAASEEHITRDVCIGVRLPKREKEERPNALSAESYVRLAITLSQMEPTSVVVAAAIAMWTGLREGEVAALRWGRYDQERHTLSVEESIGRATGGSYVKEPKNRKSVRKVPVTPQLAYVLNRRRERMVKELETAGIGLDSAEFDALYIVGDVAGNFCQPAYISRGWHTLSESMGLVGTEGRPLVFHDLRHGLATLLLAIGVPKQTVSDILGHARLSTLDFYVGSDESLKDDAGRLLAQVAASYTNVKPYELVETLS